MIAIENLGAFCEGIDKWIDDVETLAEGTLRGLAAQAFRYMVYGTPEWTGNLTASWRLTVGNPAVGYAPSIWKDLPFAGAAPEPYSRAQFNDAAIRYALSIASGELAFVRLGAPVYITNTAPYAADVQNDIVGYRRDKRVRAVNRPIEMTYAAAEKYGAEGSISTVRAGQLAATRLV